MTQHPDNGGKVLEKLTVMSEGCKIIIHARVSTRATDESHFTSFWILESNVLKICF